MNGARPTSAGTPFAWRRATFSMLLCCIAPTASSAEGGCPQGSHLVPDVGCMRDATEIEFEGSEITATGVRPQMELIMEHRVPHYPCEELRIPGRLDLWETCLLNYYGTKEADELSYAIASRFVETGACPDDSGDIDTLRQIAEHYAKAPVEEDLEALQIPPLDPGSPELEPHLPTMCGYSVSQDRWYEPRNFYCAGADCFPQAARGPKNRVRYTPLRTIPNLRKMVSEDPDLQSVGNGGSYGHLRIIPLGNEVFLATAGGMYGNIFFYGLVVVPQEAQFLRRACDREHAAAQPGTGAWRRARLRDEAQTLMAQGQALLDLRRLAETLADPGHTLTDAERASLTTEARRNEEVLRGLRGAVPVEESGCQRYQARYPRAYARARPAPGTVDG